MYSYGFEGTCFLIPFEDSVFSLVNLGHLFQMITEIYDFGLSYFSLFTWIYFPFSPLLLFRSDLWCFTDTPDSVKSNTDHCASLLLSPSCLAHIYSSSSLILEWYKIKQFLTCVTSPSSMIYAKSSHFLNRSFEQSLESIQSWKQQCCSLIHQGLNWLGKQRSLYFNDC